MIFPPLYYIQRYFIFCNPSRPHKESFFNKFKEKFKGDLSKKKKKKREREREREKKKKREGQLPESKLHQGQSVTPPWLNSQLQQPGPSSYTKNKLRSKQLHLISLSLRNWETISLWPTCSNNEMSC